MRLFAYPNFCFIAIYIRDVKKNSVKVGDRNINGLGFQPVVIEEGKSSSSMLLSEVYGRKKALL